MYGLIGSATTDLGRTSSLSSHTAGKNPGSAANIFASSLSSDSSEESYKCLPNIHRNPQKKSFTRACKGYKDLVKFISHRVVHRFGECASGCYHYLVVVASEVIVHACYQKDSLMLILFFS